MIVDTSALVAIVLREEGYEALLKKLDASDGAGIGGPTLAEAALVLSSRLKRNAEPLLVRLLSDLDLEVVPFGDQHWREAAEAFWRYGKGRHPAQLNFGDCLSYAVAKLAEQPLLFVGEDFSRTDLTAA